MYVDTDFVLALIKEDDWLSAAAEKVYREHDDLWTSPYTLIELIFIARREQKDVLQTVTAAKELIPVRGDLDTVLAAASYVEEDDMTLFDALHLVSASGERIASSDSTYDEHAQRLRLEEYAEQE